MFEIRSLRWRRRIFDRAPFVGVREFMQSEPDPCLHTQNLHLPRSIFIVRQLRVGSYRIPLPNKYCRIFTPCLVCRYSPTPERSQMGYRKPMFRHRQESSVSIMRFYPYQRFRNLTRVHRAPIGSFAFVKMWIKRRGPQGRIIAVYPMCRFRRAHCPEGIPVLFIDLSPPPMG